MQLLDLKVTRHGVLSVKEVQAKVNSAQHTIPAYRPVLVPPVIGKAPKSARDQARAAISQQMGDMELCIKNPQVGADAAFVVHTHARSHITHQGQSLLCIDRGLGRVPVPTAACTSSQDLREPCRKSLSRVSGVRMSRTNLRTAASQMSALSASEILHLCRKAMSIGFVACHTQVPWDLRAEVEAVLDETRSWLSTNPRADVRVDACVFLAYLANIIRSRPHGSERGRILSAGRRHAHSPLAT